MVKSLLLKDFIQIARLIKRSKQDDFTLSHKLGDTLFIQRFYGYCTDSEKKSQTERELSHGLK